MSFPNFNFTNNKAVTNYGNPFVKITSNALDSIFSCTSVHPTFTDTGIVVTVVTSQANEIVELDTVMNIQRTAGSGDTYGYVSYQVDAGATNPIDQFLFRNNTDYIYKTAQLKITIATAGSHTIKIRGAVSVASTIQFQVGSSLTVSQFQGVQAANGLVVTSDTLVADFTVSSADPTYADTGLDVTFTALASEAVVLHLKGEAQPSGTGYLYLAYQVDSGPNVPIAVLSGDSSGFSTNIAVSVPITGLSAGSHTIKIRAFRGTVNWTLQGTAADNPCALSIVQYRGGYDAQSIITTAASQATSTSTTNTSYEDAPPGVSVVINTLRENEPVLVCWMGVADSITTGGFGDIAINVDGTDYHAQYFGTSASGSTLNLPVAIAMPIVIATPGAHTIKLRRKYQSGGAIRTYETAGDPTFRVIQWANKIDGAVNLNNLRLPKPNFRANFADSSQVVIPAGANNPAKVVISGAVYTNISDATLDLDTSGRNGLDTGAKAANTVYYLYAIPPTSGSTFDVVCSVTGPATGPTGFSQWSYLGAFCTLAASAIPAFASIKGRFYSNVELESVSHTGNTSVTPKSLTFSPATAIFQTGVLDIFSTDVTHVAGVNGFNATLFTGSGNENGLTQFAANTASGRNLARGDVLLNAPGTVYLELSNASATGEFVNRGWVENPDSYI